MSATAIAARDRLPALIANRADRQIDLAFASPAPIRRRSRAAHRRRLAGRAALHRATLVEVGANKGDHAAGVVDIGDGAADGDEAADRARDAKPLTVESRLAVTFRLPVPPRPRFARRTDIGRDVGLFRHHRQPDTDRDSAEGSAASGDGDSIC